MEQALLRLAKQLNRLDEASLMALWDKYQGKVERFSPTSAWEEAALTLGLIQAVHLKNQLFNHSLGRQRLLPESEEPPVVACDPGTKNGPRGRVLSFPALSRNGNAEQNPPVPAD